MKPDASQRRREKVTTVKTPEDRALQTRENAGGEKESAGGIATPRAVLAKLMHSAKGKAAAGERLVHPGNPKRQNITAWSGPRHGFHHLAELGQGN